MTLKHSQCFGSSHDFNCNAEFFFCSFCCFCMLSPTGRISNAKHIPEPNLGRYRKCKKVKVHTLDVAPLRSESPPQKRSGMARVLKGFHSFTCTPTRSSAIGMSHTCFCLPSRSWYSAGTVYPVWLKKQQPWNWLPNFGRTLSNLDPI